MRALAPFSFSILLMWFTMGCGDEGTTKSTTNSQHEQQNTENALLIYPTRMEVLPNTPLHFVVYEEGAHSNSFFFNCIPTRPSSELEWSLTSAPEELGVYTIHVTDRLDLNRTATATVVVTDHPFYGFSYPPNFCE